MNEIGFTKLEEGERKMKHYDPSTKRATEVPNLSRYKDKDRQAKFVLDSNLCFRLINNLSLRKKIKHFRKEANIKSRI